MSNSAVHRSGRTIAHAYAWNVAALALSETLAVARPRNDRKIWGREKRLWASETMWFATDAVRPWRGTVVPRMLRRGDVIHARCSPSVAASIGTAFPQAGLNRGASRKKQ